MFFQNILSFAVVALSFGQVIGQSCSNTQQCVSQNLATAQAGCNGNSNNQACMCQAYQSALSSCFSGCSDSTSLSGMQQLQSQISNSCQSPSGTSNFNNPLFANSMSGQGATLIVNNGPTGLAIPMNTNRIPNNQQATISMAYTPIKISKASSSVPSLFIISFVLPMAYLAAQ